MDSGSATADTRTLTGVPSKTGSLKTGITSTPELDQVEHVDAEKAPSAAEATPNAVPDGVLEGVRLMLVFLAMMLSVFMFALDQSIVSTAIPVIVSQYNRFDAVAWIVTAYFLTQCGLILLVGQLLTVIKAKWILLGAIFFFELGSLLCAVANSMDMLIASRAIQGIGASGMFVSIIAIIAVVTRVEKRAAFMAGFGFVFVIASVIGPLLGGVFTEQLSWRWCFWINLPIGGLAAVAVVFLLPAHDPVRRENSPKNLREALRRMDWLGSALAMLFVTCLLLALQWGGNEYAWSNWRIPLLFTLGGLLCIAFFAWEWYFNEDALIPRDLMTNRTVVNASGAIFMLMMVMLGGTYQLPLFYQATRNHSAQKSGIDIIPFMIMTCIGIFVSGGAVTKWGRYYPFFIIGPPIAAAGVGMLYVIDAKTTSAFIIGAQILGGFGIGLTFQNLIMSTQAEYAPRPELIPQATGVVSFFQLTGAALGIGIVNTVQSVYLNRYIPQFAPTAPFEIVRRSTQAMWQIDLPTEVRDQVVHAYTAAISKSYIPILVGLVLTLVFGALIRNHNMLKLGGAANMHMA
ncbi:transporter [Cutaneotrichosporon oleaginosum]|uniref:Transporter n=2 Tax=Cutaneotrichosporon oleaginosum TaxID=879819 RepID=A0A0J0XY47_9TREE|nr:transporter [Cutaneotrichosporon oleaginosum]KLT45963.1 transporter [Cutaneotrichosporon oleaginosum]